jgi:UDP-N-acetylmuramoyl-tripeptide--D-alanyl-D-alanine ligase
MLTIGKLIEAITGKEFNQLVMPITDVVIDSRQVKPGALFIALPGEKVDGHDFVNHAFEAGAVAALVDKDLDLSGEVIDLRSVKSPQIEAEIHPPFVIRTESALEALQKAATEWRARHDIRVIGITGSVGKSTTKELTADVLGQRFNLPHRRTRARHT